MCNRVHSQYAHTPQRLKSALWHAVGGIVDAIALEKGTNASSLFIGALTELVWSQICEAISLNHDHTWWLTVADNSGRDLEAFTKYCSEDGADKNDTMKLTLS